MSVGIRDSFFYLLGINYVLYHNWAKFIPIGCALFLEYKLCKWTNYIL